MKEIKDFTDFFTEKDIPVGDKRDLPGCGKDTHYIAAHIHMISCLDDVVNYGVVHFKIECDGKELAAKDFNRATDPENSVQEWMEEVMAKHMGGKSGS